MLKDLKLAMDAAQGAGARVAMGDHARAIYEAFAKDHAGTDFSGIIRTR
jgi:3-hydroxyisobutyrate dehydrogenase